MIRQRAPFISSKLEQGITWLLVVAFISGQLSIVPRTEAAGAGTSTVSAGTAPPPAATSVDTFQADLFTGRATTSMPIAVPPGRKGMQPDIALTYASVSQNDWLGVGWTLDMGYIERSRRHGVPAYDSSDSFVFLFQGINSELIEVYDGSYRSRDEQSFLRFLNLGSAGWEVRDKTGRRYLFGETASARIEDGTRVFRWCLQKVIDTNGNTMELRYVKHDGRPYLETIEYTGHESGLAPANEVRFILEDRSDVISGYRVGFETTITKRLKSIETSATVDGTLELARRYDLSYVQSQRTGRSLLRDITMFGDDGVTSLPPATFTYQESDIPSYNATSTPGSGGEVAWNVRVAGYDCGHNNYGCVHPYGAPPCGVPPYGSTVKVTGSRTVDGHAVTVGSNGSISIQGGQDVQIHAWTYVYSSSTQSKSFSGTGGDVACMWVEDSGGMRGPYSWGSLSGITFNEGWSVIHIVGYNQNQGWNMGITSGVANMFDAMSSQTFSEPQLAGDVNGDAISDLIRFDINSGDWLVALGHPAGFSPEVNWLSGFGDNTYAPLIGDWNADGLTDVALYKDGTWKFATSDGSAFATGVLPDLSFGDGAAVVGDFNGDALMDLGTHTNGNWRVALGDGSSFSAEASFDLAMPTDYLLPGAYVAWDVTTWMAGTDKLGICESPTIEPTSEVDQAIVTGSDTLSGFTMFGSVQCGYSVDVTVESDGGISLQGGSGCSSGFYMVAAGMHAKTHVFNTQDRVIGFPASGDWSQACMYVEDSAGLHGPYSTPPSSFTMKEGWSTIHILSYTAGNSGTPTFGLASVTPYVDLMHVEQPSVHDDVVTHLTGDFNGDGLGDIALLRDSELHAALSDGYAFIEQAPWPVSYNDPEYTTADFNGDGLSDMAYFRKSDGKLLVEYATGNGFDSPLTLPLTFTLVSANDRIQLGEFNGDGLPDPAIFSPVTGDAELAYSGGTAPDLLDGIDNGMGGSTLITYQPSTVLSNQLLPFVTQVVKASRMTDGLGQTNTTMYHYSGGLFDPATKEFRGFNQVDVLDANLTGTRTEFHQDLYLKGRPFRSTVIDGDGNLWSVTSNSWSSVDLFPGLDIYFTQLDQRDVLTYDGDSTFNQVRTRYTYDQYGNVTATLMDGDLSITGDERSRTTTYLYNETDWILDVPSQVEIRDASGTAVAKRRYYYDGSGSGSTLPAQGNLTRKEEWLDRPTERWVPFEFTYDAYGNIETVTDSEGHVTSNTWDGASFTFLEEVSNPIVHVQSRTHDPRTGQVLTRTDENGVTAFTAYDTLGRSVQAGYLDPSTGQPIVLEEKTYDVSTVPTRTSSVVYTLPNKQGGLVTHAFSDGLGRIIQTRSPAEDPTMQIVGGATEYDALGRPVKKWTSYLDSLSTVYIPHTSVTGLAPPDEYTYDPVGRLVSTRHADGTTSSVIYEDTAFTTIDQNGSQVRNTIDAYGNLVLVEEFNAGEVYSTSYTYDARDNRIGVVDELGHTTTITFDSLNRKVAFDDPDMGYWTYAYDDNNNLVAETNPRGITITQSYDALGRILQRSYSNGQAPVTYHYDETTSSFGKGRLTSFSDGSTTARSDYDFMGRVIANEQAVESVTYTVSRTYDLIGRVTTASFPNGDTLQYTYNPQGNVETIVLNSLVHGAKSIVNGVGYNAAGQITRMEYGNGVTSDYTYDPETFRLEQLVSQSPSGIIQDFTYAFDNAGNLETISDGIHSATQSFQYDDLHRLVAASGSGYGTRSYAYDEVGNMVEKAGVTMAYGAGSAGPHALTSTGDGTTMSYDANGNVVAKNSSSFGAQMLAYDAEDRLVSVQGDGAGLLLELEPGWNLVSFPYLEQAEAVTNLLDGFGVDYDQLTRLNPISGDFESHAGDVENNQFATLDPSRGYWLYVTDAQGTDLSMPSTSVTPPEQSLSPGWHMLGGASTAMPVEQWLSGMQAGTDYGQVLRFDRGSGQLVAATDIEAGEACYVEVLQHVTWRPPAASGGSGSVQFAYNGEGARIKKMNDTGTTLFLGDSYEIAPGGETTQYVYAGAQRIAAFKSSGELNFYHGDHLGSSNVITDDSGTVVELAEYTPYGELSRREGSANVPQKFTGQYLDEETGLYYFNARYYDVSVGRFLSPDTLVQSQSNPQTLNRYAYAGNNPVLNIDPSGHFFFAAIAALISKITIASVIQGAIIGSLIGGATAALTGGDIGQGFLMGAISGAIFGAIGDFGLSGMKQVFAHTVGGALSGSVGSLVTGGDPLLGALIGGFAAGAAAGLGQLGIFQASAGDGLGKLAGDFVTRAVVGGLVGGATAAAFGGDFLQGMTDGMFSAAIAYAANYMLHEYLYPFDKDAYHQKVREILIEKGFTDNGDGTFTRQIPHGSKRAWYGSGKIEEGTVMTVKLTDTSAIQVQLNKPVHLSVMKLGSTTFSEGTIHMNEATKLFFASSINFSNPKFTRHAIAKDINLLDLDFSQLDNILRK